MGGSAVPDGLLWSEDIGAGDFWPSGMRYNRYVRADYDVLTNFFVQLFDFMRNERPCWHTKGSCGLIVP